MRISLLLVRGAAQTFRNYCLAGANDVLWLYGYFKIPVCGSAVLLVRTARRTSTLFAILNLDKIIESLS